MMLNKIILASRNPHKIAEMKAILADLGIELISALDVDALEEVEEDQPDLEGNALKKAVYVHKVTGIPAVADDTGLEVDALNGEPGVYSARYAGEQATYEDNVGKLLSEMRDKVDRKARFRTVIALVYGDSNHTFNGLCEGEILREPAGEGGFGYDPVFLPNGYQESFAQLTPEVKNRISHRGRAIQLLMQFLASQQMKKE